MDEMVDPLGAVARWDAAAKRAETACGDGRMVWRSWGEGRPVLLLHGGAGSWRHWIRTLPAFAHRHVLAPDLPGLGESDLPPMPWSAPEIGRIVSAGLDQLLGPDQGFDVVGFSFGSIVSGTIAAQRADRVGTVLLTGASGLGTARGKVVLEKVRNKVGAERTEAHRVNLSRLMIANLAAIDAQALAIQEWNSRHARLTSVDLSASTVLRDALEAALPRGPARLCAVWGAEDAVCRDTLPERVATLRALCPAADTRIIPGAGHWVAYEAAAAFNTMAAEMLDGP